MHPLWTEYRIHFTDSTKSSFESLISVGTAGSAYVTEYLTFKNYPCFYSTVPVRRDSSGKWVAPTSLLLCHFSLSLPLITSLPFILVLLPRFYKHAFTPRVLYESTFMQVSCGMILCILHSVIISLCISYTLSPHFVFYEGIHVTDANRILSRGVTIQASAIQGLSQRSV